MTITGMTGSGAWARRHILEGSSTHEGESVATHISAPSRLAEIHATSLRALLVMSDEQLCHRAEATLRLAGFQPIAAPDTAAAMRLLDCDQEIGVIVIQGLAGDSSAGDFITDVRQRARRPLAAVLMVFDTPISAMRDIARLGNVEIVVLPTSDAELAAAARNAARWCESARQADALRHSTLELLSVMQDHAGRLLGQMDDGTALSPPAQTLLATAPLPRLKAETLTPAVNSAGNQPATGAGVGAGMIKTLLRLQSLQQAAFGQGVIDVAAWVMLLDLLLSHINGKRLGVTALCVGAGVPLTTALRRIDELIASGLAERQADPLDRRRSFVAITEKGNECVRMYVELLRQALQIQDQS